MKNIKSILFALIAILTLTACQNSEPDPYLEVDHSIIYFVCREDAEYVAVYSNVDWTASSSERWCKITITKETSYIHVEADENTSTESREATIVVQGGNITKYVYVTQDGSKPQPQANGIEDVHNTQTDQPAYAPKH